MRALALSLTVLLCAFDAGAAEKVYRNVSGTLTEIPQREAGHRYRMFSGPDGQPAYLEFTPAEETTRDTEEALPPPPFLGPGRVVAQRAGQVVPNNVGTAYDYTSEVVDNANFHDNATNPDRITIPVSQAGVYDVRVEVRFNEASAAAGCTANTGDRLAQIRIAGAAAATTRVRASTASDTEFQVSASDRDLNVGDVIRVFVAHSCGGTMQVDSRVAVHRNVN